MYFFILYKLEKSDNVTYFYVEEYSPSIKNCEALATNLIEKRNVKEIWVCGGGTCKVDRYKRKIEVIELSGFFGPPQRDILESRLQEYARTLGINDYEIVLSPLESKGRRFTVEKIKDTVKFPFIEKWRRDLMDEISRNESSPSYK